MQRRTLPWTPWLARGPKLKILPPSPLWTISIAISIMLKWFWILSLSRAPICCEHIGLFNYLWKKFGKTNLSAFLQAFPAVTNCDKLNQIMNNFCKNYGSFICNTCGCCHAQFNFLPIIFNVVRFILVFTFPFWTSFEQNNFGTVFLSGIQISQKKPVKNEQKLDLDRAEFLLRQGLDEDEAGNEEEAVELYLQAAELCLKTVNVVVYHFSV